MQEATWGGGSDIKKEVVTNLCLVMRATPFYSAPLECTRQVTERGLTAGINPSRQVASDAWTTLSSKAEVSTTNHPVEGIDE